MIKLNVPRYFVSTLEGRYLDLGEMKWKDIGEDFVMSFVIYRLILHRVPYY
jgi:hypothetical protein